MLHRLTRVFATIFGLARSSRSVFFLCTALTRLCVCVVVLWWWSLQVEVLAAIIGAICHDFNHPGTNNSFEVKLGTERSVRHSDTSVLERHHLVCLPS